MKRAAEDKVRCPCSSVILVATFFGILSPSMHLQAAAKEPVAIEAEQFANVIAEVRPDAASEGKAVVFTAPNHEISTHFNWKGGPLTVWMRVYWDLANAISGDCNSVFLSLDGKRRGVVSDEAYDRWHWVSAGPYDLVKGGRHEIAISARELPVRLDKIVLTRGKGKAPLDETFIAEDYPEALPFGLPNPVKARQARQISGWRLLGDLAPDAKINVVKGVPDEGTTAIRISLPAGGRGVLALAPTTAIHSSPAFVDHNRPQQLELWAKLNGPAELTGIYADASGEVFEGDFIGYVREPSATGWRLLTINLGVASPKTGILRREGGDDDSVVDFPARLTYLVIRKPKVAIGTTLALGRPTFRRVADVTAHFEDGRSLFSEKTFRARFVVANRTAQKRMVIPFYSVVEIPRAGHEGAEAPPFDAGRARRFSITLPPRGTDSFDASLSVAKQGLYCLYYGIGCGEPKRRYLAVGAKEEGERLRRLLASMEKTLGAFRFDPEGNDRPLKKSDGTPLLRSEVKAWYGRPGGFIISCDGVDVCSEDYALKMGYAEPLRPEGRDLSDAAGWPEIHIPPGVVAIDPTLGRFHFAIGDRAPIKSVAVKFTGFGVPGSGRPYIQGDYALVNSGEGYPTVTDIADKGHPRVAGYIPTWYFTSSLYPLRAGGPIYLSNSRGALLVLRDFADPTHPGRVEPIHWEKSWGRAFLSALRKDGIAYKVADDAMLTLDLSNPDSPKEVARYPMKGLTALLFAPDNSLAAATVEGGKRLALLRFTTPTKPEQTAIFDNVSMKDASGKIAYGRPLAFDGKRLVIGHPQSTGRYWHCKRLSFFDVSSAAAPVKASDLTFDDRHTFLHDVILAGQYAYAIDGREIASGHTVQRGQRSRLYVLDISELRSPRVVATYKDPMPTEFRSGLLLDDTLFINDYNFGLRLFDMSSPQSPRYLGGAPVSAEGHWGFVHDDIAFVAHTFGGTMHAINIAEPEHPFSLGYYWDGQWLNYAARIRGRGDTLYIPTYSGLTIVDFSDLMGGREALGKKRSVSSPRRIGEFLDAEGKPLRNACLALSPTHAFATSGQRLLVYRLADPQTPKLVASLDLDKARGYRVERVGDVLFMVAFYRMGRIVTVDISKPERPKVLANFEADELRYGGQKIPFKLKDSGGNGLPGVAYSRGYLYVGYGGSPPKEPYLLIFDVRDPAAPRFVKPWYATDRKGWQYFLCDVITDGNMMYLGDYGREDVYDISDPLSPKLIATYSRSYSWQVGSLQGDYLYVPKLDGLEILDVPRPSQVPTGKVVGQLVRR